MISRAYPRGQCETANPEQFGGLLLGRQKNCRYTVRRGLVRAVMMMSEQIARRYTGANE